MEDKINPELSEVLKPIINRALEYERLSCYLQNFLRERGCKYAPASKKARVNYNIPFESMGNSICGLLELLKEYEDGKT
jgi:hypothetical protein